MYEPADIEQLLRQEWWGNHGYEFCYAYGDDGEMQCQNTTRHPGLWDFKRTPIVELHQRVQGLRLERVAKAFKEMQEKR